MSISININNRWGILSLIFDRKLGRNITYCGRHCIGPFHIEWFSHKE